VTLERRIDAAAGPVWGDSHRLQQVVWNLLSNAIKFTGPGGARRRQRRPRRPHVVVRVADTGQGIAPESCRSSSTASARRTPDDPRHGGLGLGLAIVH